MANRLHSRSASAGIDNKIFREAIAKMRHEVLESQAETQRVRDQLNCLVMLVKRAWIGDQAAAAHVAKIVGTDPPTFLARDSVADDQVKTKSRPLHHWAMLSIGLMNRHLRQLESQALSRARGRLQQRQEYLDQELVNHRELLDRASGRGLVRKTTNSHLEQSQKPRHAWGSRAKASKPPVSQLSQPEFDYPDRDFRPAEPEPGLPSSMVEHLAREALAEREFASATRDKYSQPDLFCASYAVPDRTKPKRPLSGKPNDQRTRPKSAVITATKGERPLKYETTRPISGKPSNAAKPRAKSAKAHTANRVFEMTEAEPPNRKGGKCAVPGDVLDSRAGNRSGVVGGGAKRGHTRHEDTVSEGLRKIETMEEDFIRTAKMLQDKLGISGSGAI